MKTICIPTNDRPELLERLIDSIGEADRHEKWKLIFSCEPNPAIADRIVLIPGAMIHINWQRKGCRANTFNAIKCAHEAGSEFTLYLEDDCVISKDALTLTEQFYHEPRSGVVCLRRWHDTQDAGSPEVVTKAKHGLLGCGFAFRREMFEVLEKYWFMDDPSMGGKMWDWSVDWGFQREGVATWRPMVNRSQSFGQRGTHTQGSEDLNLFGPRFQGSPVKEFRFL